MTGASAAADSLGDRGGARPGAWRRQHPPGPPVQSARPRVRGRSTARRRRARCRGSRRGRRRDRVPRRRAPRSENPIARRALELGITILSPHPSSIYPAPPDRRALAQFLRDRADEYALVCVEHGARPRWGVSCPGCRDAHLSSPHLRSSPSSSSTPRGRGALVSRPDLVKAQRLERRALEAFSLCSPALAPRRFPRCPRPGLAGKIKVIADGVDLAAMPPTPVPGSAVAVPRSLAYAPNVDGATWFAGEVWPLVRAALPDAELVLAGRDPTARCRRSAFCPASACTPTCPRWPSTSGRACRGRPPAGGHGTRLKALEASRPTPGGWHLIGLDGIGIVEGRDAIIRDDRGGWRSAGRGARRRCHGQPPGRRPRAGAGPLRVGRDRRRAGGRDWGGASQAATAGQPRSSAAR